MTTPLPLPAGITSRLIPTKTLTFHILESNPDPSTPRPLLLLLHGFPELAFSWRKVIPPLAAAGYHVVAPDQRGFGRTTGWDTRPFSEVDLNTFTLTSVVRDMVTLVHALGYRSVQCVVGHDLGAVTAAMCALVRPDFFKSVALLSHPFNGSPVLPFGTAASGSSSSGEVAEKKGGGGGGGGGGGAESAAGDHVHGELAARGRKHYKWYYSTEPANEEMVEPVEGLGEFLRGYFHLKNMREAVRRHMESESEGAVAASKAWLSDEELAVYVSEYARTGFQGGLNWYRVRTAAGGRYTGDFDVYAGRKIEVPAAFVSGKADWGIYQEPGALEKMVDGRVCSDFRVLRLVDGVGHWAPQECPEVVVEVVLELLRGL
ncbi:epoxide hydrolase [Aspergillus nomiae NRRL 13137]|uniref:Epoxide hydrolase n=1 Tax=Aspergillus nomiae NRRL (strain ATCC 15546 / NRRL 13137 / CBS 260.88 / M93) TaxID=1509407 RepID=A0A0L1IYJ0_ASPN3|nr:epoxide hydrolase [Aspergillus nomiae NRRL 13137]KNG84572.1 epoxide hydrolase [Aspergillus nomiae NRRL 13137]